MKKRRRMLAHVPARRSARNKEPCRKPADRYQPCRIRETQIPRACPQVFLIPAEIFDAFRQPVVLPYADVSLRQIWWLRGGFLLHRIRCNFLFWCFGLLTLRDSG